MATFTATYGVEFGEQAAAKKDGGELGPYVTWAKFERDRERDAPTGGRVYVFTTDDEKVAERLRAVNDYGITEVAPVAEETPAPADPVTP